MLFEEGVFLNAVSFCVPFVVCNREQDDDLDELSASLGHVGHVGLVIHEELSLQVNPSSHLIGLGHHFWFLICIIQLNGSFSTFHLKGIRVQMKKRECSSPGQSGSLDGSFAPYTSWNGASSFDKNQILLIIN